MRTHGPGADRPLRALVAAVVLAAPLCGWLCAIPPRPAARHRGAEAAETSPGAMPCHHGGRDGDAGTPADSGSPCAGETVGCRCCTTPALVTARTSPSDVAPGTALAPDAPAATAVAVEPAVPLSAVAIRQPPASASLALLRLGTIVLRL